MGSDWRRGIAVRAGEGVDVVAADARRGGGECIRRDLRSALADYQASLSATLENLVSSATDLPVVDESAVGEVPEFEAPQVTLPFEELNSWVNGLLFDAERGANVAYGSRRRRPRKACNG
jgi:hypothetical protein